MDQIRLQVQDISGNFVNVGSCMNQDQIISRQLDTLVRTYKRLVRAIDKNGNIVQLKE